MTGPAPTVDAVAFNPRHVLPPGVALAASAVAFTTVYAAAGALMPLLVVYQQQWDLSPTVLTVVFAVFAAGVPRGRPHGRFTVRPHRAAPSSVERALTRIFRRW